VFPEFTDFQSKKTLITLEKTIVSTKDENFTPTIKCGHCGNKAPMKIVASYSEVDPIMDSDGDVVDEVVDYYELVRCPACERVMLRHSNVGPWDDPEADVVKHILYPKEPNVIRGLPEEVRKAYEAALKVRSIDTNAFAVLLGRVLDKICEDRKAKGESLSQRLSDLAQRGEIPSRLAEMAKSLKELRNVGAHANLGELTAKEIPFLDDLCKAILEYVYSGPELLARVQQHLEKIKLVSKKT